MEPHEHDRVGGHDRVAELGDELWCDLAWASDQPWARAEAWAHLAGRAAPDDPRHLAWRRAPAVGPYLAPTVVDLTGPEVAAEAVVLAGDVLGRAVDAAGVGAPGAWPAASPTGVTGAPVPRRRR